MAEKKKKIHLALDRKAIVLFALGACIVGVLVFADGFLAGMGLYRKSVWSVLVAGRQAQAAQAEALAANRKQSPPRPAAANAAPAATTLAANTAAPAAIAPAAAVTTAAAPANTCGLTVPLAAQASAPAQPEFDLQLGAFQDAANAARLVTSLKAHGCTAQVMQLTDTRHRVWNVVRIGPFATLAQAAAAAAQLRRSDGLLALVRPVAAI
ncbi:MAG: SPOR domain-containing protein [Terriglobales bacterium]